MGYIILVAAFIVVVFVSLGLHTAFRIAHNEKRTDYSILEYSFPRHESEYEQDIKAWVKIIQKNYVKINSPYKYKINALEIKNNNKDRWIILLHGVTLNHKSVLDLAYMYSIRGFNTFLWDSRNHGESEGENISYGYYEKYDLQVVVDYLRKNHGDNIKIGMHGISMGAGILLSYASGVRDDCRFYIADCPYSNFYNQAFTVAKKTIKMPRFIIRPIMFFAKIFIKRLFKFDLAKIDIAGKIHKIKNPVLFINCRDDDYIDPKMTEELYNKCNSDHKRIIWFDEGGHGGAFTKNRTEYIDGIEKFLEEINF